MARWSETAGHIKLQAGDIVTILGVCGKVLDVIVMGSGKGAGILLVVDLTNGKGMPNIFNLQDIEAVRWDGGWHTLKGEMIAA